MLTKESIHNIRAETLPSSYTPKESSQSLITTHLIHFSQYLDDYFWSTTTSSSSHNGRCTDCTTNRRRPTLLNIICDEEQSYDILSIAATKYNLCSKSITLHTNEKSITNSKMLAFEQKVFNKCHFFHVNYEDDPRLLLNNPHFMADNINESDVVLIHSNAWSSPDRMVMLIPLLALLSSKKNGRKFVTSVRHNIPMEHTVNKRLIKGTDLCVYDGIVDNRTIRKDNNNFVCAPPPEPVDGDEIDKEFARSVVLSMHCLEDFSNNWSRSYVLGKMF